MATLEKHRGVLIDVVCVVFVGLMVLSFEVFGHPFQRGFFCSDDSIRYPMTPNTISTLTLVIVCFLSPILVFFAVEGFRLFDTSTPRDSWYSVSNSLLRSLYEMFGVFLFGAGLNQVTVDVGKYTVGRLRPHFVDVCQPSVDLTTFCSLRPYQYITPAEFTCRGSNLAAIDEARLSFPSGHAALAFYAAVYVSVFLQHRLYWRSVRLPRHLAQGVVLTIAWFTALSRVQDFMHHPTDVLAGAAIGSGWALIMTRYVIDMRLDNHHGTKDELRSLRTTPMHIPGPNNV